MPAPAHPRGPVVAAAMAHGRQGNSRQPWVKCEGTAYLVSLLIKLGCKAPVTSDECVLRMQCATISSILFLLLLLFISLETQRPIDLSPSSPNETGRSYVASTGG